MKRETRPSAIARPRRGLNLLPEEGLLQKSARPWRVRGAALPLLAGTGLVALSTLVAITDARRLDTRHRAESAVAGQIETRIADLEGLASQIAEDRRHLERLHIVSGRLERWDEERYVLPDLLRELALEIGDGVVLENLSRRGDELVITGRTGSTGAARSAAERFAGMDRVRTLTLQYVERGGGGDVRATMLGDHRFSLAGALRFNSREPEPLVALIAALGGDGEGS